MADNALERLDITKENLDSYTGMLVYLVEADSKNAAFGVARDLLVINYPGIDTGVI
ncbi:hypothetical protein [Hahella sp. CCB-MM4]|uniref:hypothetical protein n=1 Tax=Hahella sp. (strain CCB-MM4) TaxID=1926491 RepID=UPI00143D3178|nr:hypothetical protein [Hahella sp. CCB-MM4]